MTITPGTNSSTSAGRRVGRLSINAAFTVPWLAASELPERAHDELHLRQVRATPRAGPHVRFAALMIAPGQGAVQVGGLEALVAPLADAGDIAHHLPHRGRRSVDHHLDLAGLPATGLSVDAVAERLAALQFESSEMSADTYFAKLAGRGGIGGPVDDGRLGPQADAV